MYYGFFEDLLLTNSIDGNQNFNSNRMMFLKRNIFI